MINAINDDFRRLGRPSFKPYQFPENVPRTAQERCRICHKADCDDDCEELAQIYRESQREKLRDVDPDELEHD